MKGDISGGNIVMCDGKIDAVSFLSPRVTHKDSFYCSRGKLRQARCVILDKGRTPKHSWR